MLHLIAPVESTRSSKSSFAAQGLGDRTHLLTILWAIASARNCQVTLHLSSDKNTLKKRASFEELLQFFPSGSIELHFHDFSPTSNLELEDYLLSRGIKADTFYYIDHPGWREQLSGVEVSQFLKKIPLLTTPSPIGETRLVTSQWDSTGEDRKFATKEIEGILKAYTNQGYEVITVGGEATKDCYRDSLSSIAGLMSKAAFHVGIDSGFMHFAQLFLPPNRIHVYSKPQNYWSHHLFRGIENGMVLNENFQKISSFEMKKIAWRYDSPKLLRAWHTGKQLLHRKL